ncbi:MAG: hypothetical protein AAB559_02165 [Patescibacteria group bacterium]
MLETPHVALGVAIAVAIPNPLISIPLAFASHFALDMTPHWNPHLNTETKKYGYLTNKTLLIIGIDLACAAILTAFVSKGNMNILLVAFVSILPDVVEGPYFLLGWKNELIKKWINFQKSIQSEANLFWGLLTQVLVILGALYIIS